MSETKWTQGPWQVKRSGCISNRDGELIATTGYCVAVVGGGVAGEEDDANTVLIAAAPKMYEALRGLLGWYAALSNPGDVPGAIALGARLREARAALASADGQGQKP